MTTNDLVPIRYQLLKIFNLLAEKAINIDSPKSLINFPSAYKFQEKTSVNKQALKKCLVNEFDISQEKLESAFHDLEDHNILIIHEVELFNERANYVQLTANNDFPNEQDIVNITSKNNK